MFRVCGLIWTHNPDLHLLKQTIEAALSNVDFLIIIDNGSSNVEEIKRLVNIYGIKAIFLPKNLGVAALNIGLEILAKRSCEWILILDDDSIITNPKAIQEILTGYDTIPSHIRRKIGVISIIDANSIPITLKNKLMKMMYSTFVVHSDTVMFSGAMIRADVIKSGIQVDKELFLYHADVDFFTRIRKMGFMTIIYTKPMLRHRLGIPLVKPINLGFYKIVSTTTPSRFYYIARNAMYLLLRRRLSPLQFFLSLFRFILPLLIEYPIGTIKALILGIIHGTFGILGIWKALPVRP